MGHRRPSPCYWEPEPLGGISQLAPPVKWLLDALRMWSHVSGREEPIVISTVRTAARQGELQRRWDAGDRRGLAVRPADPENSKHVPDENGHVWAFDLGNKRDWLEAAGAYVASPSFRAQLPKVTWGGSWLVKDYGHFQIDGMREVASIRLV